ncbi:HDOD domain-containing protein [Aestuariibacter sp. A3R04]|uniref:HDOD domain-containing protein n=1 Tax=Aestuariibacter sp. A3R04 TaxID=2841571 RepID=UPI001C08CCF5|nr:HDOD domain-containing protein [Aestuariibacter sp. A3R04]MBU3021565.1 HDOD domain-containing protein [Aestuariibacter sp. A3R04]
MEKYVEYATQSFTLPNICIRLRDVLDDNRSDMDDLAKLIGIDPSLTAKILKMANSALFRFPAQVDSITKAISVIGGEALYNLVMAETASTAFKHFNSEHIRLDNHWVQSVYNGLVAKNIAKLCHIRGSERFFVMGILHNLSELVIAKHAPEKYLDYIQRSPALLPWENQQAVFGFSFAQCSGAIMEKWQLPMPLFYPVSHVHDLDKQAADVDIGLLAYAMRVTIREKNPVAYGNIELLSSDSANKLKVSGDDLANVISYANSETDKIAFDII